MKRVVLLATLLFLAVHAQTDSTEDDEKFAQYRQDLIDAGATPEEADALLAVHNSTRPSLVCLCHHESNVTTCGVDGHRYLNKCVARCARVRVACHGEHCGDCLQYALEEELDVAAIWNTTAANQTVHHNRRLLGYFSCQ